MQVIEAGLSAKGKKFAIVVARFNSFIVESLLEGAVDTLKRIGNVDDADITVIRIPGAFELPLAVQKVAATNKYDGIIALGAVIRGGTPHFEYVAGECTKGIAQVMMQYSLPVAFGVLTVESIEQAIERAGTKMGNKGGEAAMSTLEMVNVLAQL